MRDPNNPYRPYTIYADNHDRAYTQRAAEEAARKAAYHKSYLEALNKPVHNWGASSSSGSSYSSGGGGGASLSRVLLVIAIYALPFLIFA